MSKRCIRVTARHRREPDVDKIVLALLHLIRQQSREALPAPKSQSGNTESAA